MKERKQEVLTPIKENFNKYSVLYLGQNLDKDRISVNLAPLRNH